MSALSTEILNFLSPTARIQPVTVEEAMEAACELRDAGYGRALPTFDEQRERRARITICELEERYILAGGAK